MRDKFLTEAMGECWHSKAEMRGSCMDGGYYDYCPKCKDGVNLMARNKFSTWTGFGKLMSIDHEIVPRGYLRGAAHAAIYQCTAEDKTDEIPDRFANAVYEFLKERT